MIESTKLLKEAQAKEDSAEAKASLPTLSVADLERKVKSIPIEITSVQGVDVITHDVPSSGENKPKKKTRTPRTEHRFRTVHHLDLP